MTVHSYAAFSTDAPLGPYAFEARALRPNDVQLEVLYCGVCHSDLHYVRNDWGVTHYPVVPGHEIVGRVTAVGADVTRHKAGDLIAVGTLVDSCQHCDQCGKSHEQFCREGATFTYGAPDRLSGELTTGGYAKQMVVREEFVLKMPEGLDPVRAAPILCAGVTNWTPLRQHKIGPGSRVGVVGMGGLGHMAIKLAVGLGAEVTVISRSKDKEADALGLGAHRLLVSSDTAALETAASSLDLIIDTVPSAHEVAPYVSLLDVEGALVLVGYFGPLPDADSIPLIFGGKAISGSQVGGLADTQELLNFCAEKNILPECEIIRIDQINEAFDRLEKGDVRYRFVIDMASLDAAE
ncbi:NAD(P)-dependent alcohol dehydrogenase [Paracoccus sp. (in: a-proteobacteria)]|uniref:NAD(P)-dependent alcohol dehydrogenase n=1 Tax=Paracoccus sp. TaxID=267 RepID=UPI002AFDF30D|nr:NAD(P)-dependent alcohol dehydrogenase [Paracoccus sp. (in: a-proteobacteria)]